MKHFTTRTTIALALGLGLTLALLYALSVNPRPVLADPGDLFVTTGGTGTTCAQGTPCSLQMALTQAIGGDTIYVARGTYTGTGSAVVTITQSITLAGGWDGAPNGDVVRDPDAYPTTLDGENARRGVYISGYVTPRLDGFIVTGGNATGLGGTPYDQDAGGGIYSEYASPIISNNVITDNLGSSGTSTYGRGGGVHLANASATSLISGNLIISNTASTGDNGYGGGISLYESNVTICENRVISNTGSTADNGHGGGGGIFVSDHHLWIVNNIIQGNTASEVMAGRGGGLYLDSASALIESNLIADNQTDPSKDGYGGGIYDLYGSPTLNNNRILSNTAKSGGGIYVFRSSSLTLTNNVIARNTAQGLYFYGATSHPVTGMLVNNTIAHSGSDGVFLRDHVALTLTNNIIVRHTTGIFADDSTTTAMADYTLFFDNTDGDTGGLGSITSTDEITGSDPLFVDPAGWNYHLRSGSPAIDAGITVPWLVDDIDGDARPWPTGGAYDIGADEARWLPVYLPLVLRNAP
jgi:parallel beta-helix repeat protein